MAAIIYETRSRMGYVVFTSPRGVGHLRLRGLALAVIAGLVVGVFPALRGMRVADCRCIVRSVKPRNSGIMPALKQFGFGLRGAGGRGCRRAADRITGVAVARERGSAGGVDGVDSNGAGVGRG